jgi:hypothetical protein
MPELAQWCVVSLGNARDPAALPELLPLLATAKRRGQIAFGFATAEAIARIVAGRLDKVVLARDLAVWSREPFDAIDLALTQERLEAYASHVVPSGPPVISIPGLRQGRWSRDHTPA